MNNNSIINKKTIISLFLSVILVTGTITALSTQSSFMINAQAQPSYYNNGIDNNYKSQKDNVVINKIKCLNDNININGQNTGDVNIGNKNGQGYLGANSYGGGEGYYNDGYNNNNKQGKWFDDCVINNNNNNTNIVSTIPSEPTTATLTVKKQVFGCDDIEEIGIFVEMDCMDLRNNSSEWLDCNNSNITNSIFCQSLPESIFDIEVVDDQGNQIREFEGSELGTTIENLEPGTYTVNEIEHSNNIDQLGESSSAEQVCINSAGFTDGGALHNSTSNTNYDICFEYEDEQGNDCSNITLAAGEERTCIVKNYIRNAADS